MENVLGSFNLEMGAMDIVKQLEILVQQTAARALQAAYDRRHGDKRELLQMLAIVHGAHLRALATEIETRRHNVHNR